MALSLSEVEGARNNKEETLRERFIQKDKNSTLDM